MVKRQLFLSAILLFIIVFVIGIIVGRSISNPELSKITQVVKQSELTTESYVIEQELLADFEKNCDLAKLRLAGLSDELWQLGKLLGTETAKQDLGEEQYHVLKQKFHLMQIKTYTLYHRLHQDCASNVPVILFYYQQNDNQSQEQGRILDQLVANFDVKVFAVEYNYSQELRFVEEYYKIMRTPSVVINFEVVREGMQSYEQLVALIRNEQQ